MRTDEEYIIEIMEKNKDNYQKSAKEIKEYFHPTDHFADLEDDDFFKPQKE